MNTALAQSSYKVDSINYKYDISFSTWADIKLLSTAVGNQKAKKA